MSILDLCESLQIVNRRGWKVFTALGWSFLILLTACEPTNEEGPRYGGEPPRKTPLAYTLAVHPLHNPAKLMDAYQPLVDYLNAHLDGPQITLEASRDYRAFEEKYRKAGPDFLLPNPWQTIQATSYGYHVIATAGDALDFKGLLIVRRDSGIESPLQLKGKAVSYPSATALAACIMPQYFLHRNGIRILQDIENRYVGSQESSIMNVYLGKTAAGATWPHPWRAFQREHPIEAAELRVAWETEQLINNSFMARNNLPPALTERVQKLLTELHTHKEGRAILLRMETARFYRASNTDYEIVKTYVAAFERDVRPVEAQ